MINVALAFSPNWGPYVEVELFSLFKTNKAPITVYLLSDELEEWQISKYKAIEDYFGEGYRIQYLNIDEIYKELIPSTVNVSSRFTKYTLYRLVLPKVIDVDRLLYIDTDAIVNGDLSEFYNIDLGNNYIAGCLDTGIYSPQYRNMLSEIGFTDKDSYINAGVTLYDWNKAKELCDQWIKEINTTKYSCHDQHVINKSCKGRIKVVDNKYNSSLSTGFSNAPVIAHYAGPRGEKGWDHNPKVRHHEIWTKWEKRYHDEINHISKKIHYCWFGKGEKPELAKKCIASWKKYMPDYEIIEWNEDNFDVNSNKFVKEAYNLKKYAYVTDYVRLWALFNYGGIYMDSDVEVLQSLDRFRKHRAFTGHETSEKMVTATMGSEPGHPWIKYLLNYYDNATFNTTPNTDIITKMSSNLVEKMEYGFRYLKDGVVIYPVDTFCPFNHQSMVANPTPNTYAIHHFSGSWKTKTNRTPAIINKDRPSISNGVINFVRSVGGYEPVLDTLIDPILPHLSAEYKISTECDPNCLNVVFFTENHVKPCGATVFISHGIADKRYRNAPIVSKYDYIFVSGPAWYNKMIKEGLTKDRVFINGYTKLDPIFQGCYTKTDDYKNVLFAPTHTIFDKDDRLEKYLINNCKRKLIISKHPVTNSGIPTMQCLVDASVVIADCGSTMYEAWALDKPVVIPSWLIRSRVLAWNAEFETEVFDRDIGFHALSMTDVIFKTESAISRGITKKEREFIEGIFPADLRGHSGARTAELLEEILCSIVSI